LLKEGRDIRSVCIGHVPSICICIALAMPTTMTGTAEMAGADAHVIRFQCPKCGHELEQTIGSLKLSGHMRCGGCGVGINIDTNRRLISADDKGVTFKWKDYRLDGAERYNRVMTLDTSEFIRRFLMHVLPSGFHRIRQI
jgi:predicted RNA-binding Zn-ribbon protein involved in translation (DUF1610 family)